MWYVYILKSSKDRELYVGLTNNLMKRFLLHNAGKIFSTRSRAPFEVISYEAHPNKYDAAAREKFLKSGWGKNWIKKTLHYYLLSRKLGG